VTRSRLVYEPSSLIARRECLRASPCGRASGYQVPGEHFDPTTRTHSRAMFYVAPLPLRLNLNHFMAAYKQEGFDYSPCGCERTCQEYSNPGVRYRLKWI
jgi:hypothetical protein